MLWLLAKRWRSAQRKPQTNKLVNQSRALRCAETMRCVALRCVALRCVALRCVALRCVALRCVALRCVALRCATYVYPPPIKWFLLQSITIESIRELEAGLGGFVAAIGGGSLLAPGLQISNNQPRWRS
jgi:hypothetical protein